MTTSQLVHLPGEAVEDPIAAGDAESDRAAVRPTASSEMTTEACHRHLHTGTFAEGLLGTLHAHRPGMSASTVWNFEKKSIQKPKMSECLVPAVAGNLDLLEAASVAWRL